MTKTQPTECIDAASAATPMPAFSATLSTRRSVPVFLRCLKSLALGIPSSQPPVQEFICASADKPIVAVEIDQFDLVLER